MKKFLKGIALGGLLGAGITYFTKTKEGKHIKDELVKESKKLAKDPQVKSFLAKIKDRLS